MDNELGYIISSYASLKLTSQPLKDVNLNSPAKLKPLSPQKRSSLSTNNPQEIHSLCVNSIDLVLKNFKSVKSLNSSFLRLVSSAFSQLYKLDILDKKREILKKHNSYILKLIELEDELHGDYIITLKEIKAAHDQGSSSEKDPVDAVLLESSQISLKFLVLQIIFKKFQQRKYDNSSQILLFFQNDSKFLENLNSNQKTSIIKLLLSFSRLAPSLVFKLCLNLKVLEYIHRFGLQFKIFISNLSEEQFVATIQKEITCTEEVGQIPAFLYDYLRIENNESFKETVKHLRELQRCGVYSELKWNLIIPDLGLSNNVSKLLSFANVNGQLIRAELEDLGRPSSQLHIQLGEYIIDALSSPTGDLESIILFYLTHCVHVNKNTTPVLDKLVINSVKFLESPEFLQTMLVKLQKLFTSHGQDKRLRNISNLFYNFALKQTSPKYVETYLLCCLKIELSFYNKTYSLIELSTKVAKSLKYLVSQNAPVDKIFKLVWNDEFLGNLPRSDLLQKLDCLECFSSVFQCYPLSQASIFDLNQENRAITFVMCSKYTSQFDQLPNLYESLKIEDPTLQMLCGVFYNEAPYLKAQNPHCPPLYISSSLIKSSYYLSREVKTKSTFNITKILHLYTNNWLLKNKNGPTGFEIHFLEQFVEYLKFINFQKSLNDLLLVLNKYLSIGNDSFREWYFYENLENTVSMKNIFSLSAQVFDTALIDKDFGTSVESTTRHLELLLLKLKYYMIMVDKPSLIEIAAEIRCHIQKDPLLFCISNKNSYPKKQFKQIMVLLTKLHYYSAKIFRVFGDHMGAVTSTKVCIQLSKSVLKSDGENFQVLFYLSSSFRHLISILIHLGASKDADYYIEEFSKFNDSILRYKQLYAQNNYFICYYLFVTARFQELSDLRTKSDKIFKKLGLLEQEIAVDNYKLVFYHYLAEIYDPNIESKTEVRQKLRAFLNYVEKEGKMLSNLWRLHYEYHFNTELIDLTINKSKDPYLHAMNYIINSKRLFTSAKKTLEVDPVFSTLEDSAMSIPSTFQGQEVVEAPLSAKGKSKSLRNIKKSMQDLRQSRNFILNLFNELKYLANYQIDEVHKIFALGLLTLSSISNTYHNESLDDMFNLGEFLKINPFINDKKLIEATSKSVNLMPNFNLDMVESLKTSPLGDSVIDATIMKRIPADWLVISIDICSFNGDFLVSKISKGMKTPNILRLPLSRHSSRTIDEESFSFEDAMKELNDIIEESNKTTSKERTASISTLQERQQWHKERFALDEKLGAFLDKIEYCWIGGFKGIFDQNKVDQEQKDLFKEKFLTILGQNIPSRCQRNQNFKPIEIDDFIIELFLGLGDPSSLSSTELLEDLIYFVLDILLFHGEENAYDEIDIDNIYVEVETLIKEYLMMNPTPPKHRHTILVVGKECQSIPWESLPSLRNSSTTRIPSLTMLLKLLEENKKMVVNKRNGSYILNPSGDLVKTEERFEEQIEDLCGNLNWKGIIGKRPTEEEFAKSAHDSNLFLYIGHGGGEQFIRSTTLKKMNRIAPTLLLGCSSAALRDNNLLEPYGTAYSYLVGGCPLILGNLWDVTDKDIDKFSLSLLKKWGLDPSTEENHMNISDAVRYSRDECKLKFLTGAAPVVYGLPLSLL